MSLRNRYLAIEDMMNQEKLQFRELEYKYNADNLSLTEFKKLMTEIIRLHPDKETKVVEVSSWDTYFTNENGEFIRFRHSHLQPELTIKKKINPANNRHRIEVNLPLDRFDFRGDKLEEVVRAFVEGLGYKKNFKIYKTCFIFYVGDLNYVYYIVYDENMKELRKFVEIEYSEERAKDRTESEVYEELDFFESYLERLGIGSKNRMRKSLFELFKS